MSSSVANIIIKALLSFIASTTGGSSVDITYMKLIALILPSSTYTEFTLIGEDCVEAPTSDVEI